MPYLGGLSVLGDVADPFADDFAGGELAADPRAAYVTWAAAVKANGGTVTAAPVDNGDYISAGMAAAKYPVAVISLAPTGQLNPIFHRWPDLWTNNGAFGWYRAPDSVLAYTNPQRSLWDVGSWFNPDQTDAPINQPQTVPGEPAPADPKWYDDIKGYLKIGGLIVGGLVLLNVLSYLPRRRDWE